MIFKSVLITGCSSGIGFATALALHEKGYQVIATCRKEEDRLKLVSLGVDTVLLDVSNSDSIQMAFKEILTKTKGRLDVLINNAGYGQAGALEDISREAIRNQFETNVFGLLELCSLAIPIMRQQGAGRIINIGSILGIISMPFRGAYIASKYAVEGLSDTLRLELKSSGIKVVTIEPGAIESRFRDNSIAETFRSVDMENSHFSTQYKNILATYKETVDASPFTKKPDEVIKKIIHAIESKRPKAKYPVTVPAHMLIFLKRILSTKMLDKLILYASKKEIS